MAVWPAADTKQRGSGAGRPGLDPVRWLATEQGHMEGCGAWCVAGGRRGAAVRAAGRGGGWMKKEEVSTVDGP